MEVVTELQGSRSLLPISMINIILVYPWESPLQQQELEVGDTACVYFSTERLSMTPWTTTERERDVIMTIKRKYDISSKSRYYKHK